MPFCKITKENNQPYHQLSCEITASGHQPVVVKTARAMNFTKELEENISSARELEKYPVAQKAGGARRDPGAAGLEEGVGAGRSGSGALR